MSVIGSNNNSTSQFLYSKEIYQQERILLTKGDQYPANTERETENSQPPVLNDQVSLSEEAKELQEETPPSVGITHHQGRECCRLVLLRNLFERFIGKSIPIVSSEEITNTEQNPVVSANEPPAEIEETPALPNALSLTLEYRKTETISFSTMGSFQTTDGQEVNFSLELNFTRQVLAEKTLSANFTDAISDPFTIQYDGFASQINQTSFSFTIDCCRPGEEITLEETQPSQIPEADTEENTVPKDSETVVAENKEEDSSSLANSFFDRLRVWSKDGHGKHRPIMFGVKGVGVMFHENRGMDFTLKKFSHFMNKVARAIDRFSDSQYQADNTQKISKEA